jgi:hypothetical protein
MVIGRAEGENNHIEGTLQTLNEGIQTTVKQNCQMTENFSFQKLSQVVI